MVELGVIQKGPQLAQGAEWDWDTWFERFGSPRRASPGGQRYETISMAMAATMAGGGLGLGRSVLSRDALDDGRLVRPFGPEFAMPYSQKHIVRWRAERAYDEPIMGFVDWLQTQAGQSVMRTAA